MQASRNDPNIRYNPFSRIRRRHELYPLLY
jgi:hypothetical protein